MENEDRCPDCEGTGEGSSPDSCCSTCGGSGDVESALDDEDSELKKYLSYLKKMNNNFIRSKDKKWYLTNKGFSTREIIDILDNKDTF